MNEYENFLDPAILDAPKPPADAEGAAARVLSVYRDRFAVICAAGTGFARLKTAAYRAGEMTPVVGDFVLLEWREDGESRILRTLPRRTFFARLDPSSAGHAPQAVAANFDAVLIVQSMNHDFNPRRLERYLTLAWQSGAAAAVVLTKADCAPDAARFVCAAAETAPGVEIFPVSALTGQGMEQLRAYLTPGKTAVLLGSSGVGKSTLVNALLGRAALETGEIREKDQRGRHTTTRRELLALENGALLIDTPGMRELGLWEADEGLERSFTDVEQYFGRCRFRDCRHQGEPGCAVAAALESGELPRKRWESYCKLRAEARYAEDQAGYLKEKQQRFRAIARAKGGKKPNRR